MKIADQEYRILPSLYKAVFMLLLLTVFFLIQFLALLKSQQLIIDISQLKYISKSFYTMGHKFQMQNIKEQGGAQEPITSARVLPISH